MMCVQTQRQTAGLQTGTLIMAELCCELEEILQYSESQRSADAMVRWRMHDKEQNG